MAATSPCTCTYAETALPHLKHVRERVECGDSLAQGAQAAMQPQCTATRVASLVPQRLHLGRAKKGEVPASVAAADATTASKAALPSELPLPVSAVSAGTSAVVVWPPVMQAAMAPAAAEAEVEGLPSCCMLEMGEGTVVVEVGSW